MAFVRVAALMLAVATVAAQTPSAGDLFDEARLHDVWVQLSPADWQHLLERFKENTYYRATVEWRGMRAANVGVRSRGGATRNDRKPGLQLDFDRYVPGQEFLGLDGLVLDNVWHDASMIKEGVSMALFRRMGLAAPRESYARLYLGQDRQFAGLYAIIEAVDERFLMRNFREDSGYLFEYERVDDYHFEDLGDDPGVHAKRFDPKTREDETPEQLYGPLRDLVRVIDRSPAAELETAIAPYLDLEKFFTFVGVENYLAVWDAFLGDLGMANFYLYRFAGSTKSEFIPWDQDNTFTSLDFPPWYNVHKNALMRKVWTYAPLRDTYLAQLLKVTASADGWMEREVDRQYRQIRAAALADTVKYHSNEDVEAAVDAVRRFSRERARTVREFVARIKADTNAADLGN